MRYNKWGPQSNGGAPMTWAMEMLGRRMPKDTKIFHLPAGNSNRRSQRRAKGWATVHHEAFIANSSNAEDVSAQAGQVYHQASFAASIPNRYPTSTVLVLFWDVKGIQKFTWPKTRLHPLNRFLTTPVTIINGHQPSLSIIQQSFQLSFAYRSSSNPLAMMLLTRHSLLSSLMMKISQINQS